MKKFTFLIFAGLICFVSNLHAQDEPINPTQVSNGTYWGETPPLSSLPVLSEADWEQLNIKFKKKELNEKTGERPYPFQSTSLPVGPDEAWQMEMGTKAPLAPVQNFAGQGSNSYPTDPNGDVNQDYYFQTINSIYSIYNKSGVLVAGPTNINLLFGSVPGSNCNDGDPIVLWDEAAGRWLVAEFSLCNADDRMLVAISTTSNPTGTWYQYSFNVADVPDYEKFGVWRDAYYMGTNTGGSNDIYAFQRDVMLAGGASPTMVAFTNAWRPASGFHCVPPVDNDGALAPAGTPGYFITINNDAWGGADELWIYQLAVNWTIPASSTFNRTQQIAVTPFDNNFGAGWNNIAQLGTAQKLDAVLEVLMNRPQYRNFGSYQTIVCCHTVDVDNTDHAGVRWYELRRTSGNWSIRQTGTYAPDANSRWMGSIALNSYNQIGLGYSISSSTLYPGIRYCGQSSTAYAAGAGVMDIAEDVIQTGATSQTGSNRWGDYTMLAVDPSDNQSFWYTNQYFQSSSPVHPTRIASFKFDPYCAASTTSADEFISNVTCGTINNTTGWQGGVANYTAQSTTIPSGGSQAISVVIGPPSYTGDVTTVWVDWNNDFSFGSGNEQFILTGDATATGTISVPMGTASGTYRMRIRCSYNTSPPNPCGAEIYGEIEDYSINVIDYCTASSSSCDEYISRVQLGTIDNSTGCTNYGNYTAISTNFGLTATKILTVTNGNPIWSADQCGVWIDWNRDMDFADANETISVSGNPGVGPYSASITPPAGTTPGPVRMRVRITYNETPNPCGTSSYGEVEDYTLILNGPNYWTGAYNYYWHNAANWSAGHIPLDDEDVIMTTNGYYPPSVDFYNEACRTLTINSGAGLIIAGYSLTVGGDINISGNLTMNNAAGIINVKGNWNNYAGAPGFTEGPGRVVFNGGAYHQYCTNETFNILEVNKTGGAFRPYIDHNVVCAAYDWTAGAVDVYTGSFTANDLLDNGIFGAYYCNPGGTINLNNLLGNTWVDLNGEMHIYGGTVNVSGIVSDWPYTANAVIEMTDGVLDFKTCGISINESAIYTLTDNITGGTIRTAAGISGNRADFTPTAGTIELYGSSDAGIFQSNGCSFWDVNINKSAKNASIGEPILLVSDERIDKTGGNGGKANSVSLNSNILITNGLTISSGTLEVGGYTCSVSRAVNVYGILSMTNPIGVFNVGTYAYDNLRFYSGSTGNLAAGNINLNSWIAVDAGSTFTASTSNTIHIIGSNYGGGLANLEPTAVFGNIDINKTANPSYLASDYAGPYNIQGNFTVQPGNSFQTGWNSMHVAGLLTDQPTSSIYLYYASKDVNSQTVAPKEEEPGEEELKSGAKGGGLIIDTDFTLNGLLDVADGSALVHGIFHLASTGNLNITSGSFIADGPLFTKNWEYIDGHLGLTSGLFEITNNSIQFSSTGTSTVSGGIIRVGEAFAAQNAGNFQPTGGTLEIVGVGLNTIYCNNGNYFYNLLINRDPAASSHLYTNIIVNSNLSVNSGTLVMYYTTADVLGGVTVNGGNLLVSELGNLRLASGTSLNVNNGGKLSVIGTSGSPAKLTRISTGYYSLNVQSGGTIAAQFGTFEYMNTIGVNLLSGSLVDPVYSFHRCTFQNGQAAGRLLSIENNQVFNVENAVFPTNTWSGLYNVYKAVNAGTVNFVTATGGFAGESFDYDPTNRVNWTGRLLTLKAYLEGPFNGVNMNTTLNGILPLSHPFNVTLPYFGGTPKWYFTGTGSVGAIPNANIVDWVLLDIRDAASAATATGATSVAKIPAFILNNGNIVALDGTSSPQISNAIVNNLFVVIYSRNHEGIMNANLIPYSAGLYTYDYTTGAAQVIGGTAGHKELSPGKWGMRAGDGNGDGSVTTFDKTNVWGLPSQVGKTGYLPSDFSFDRQTNNKDKNDKWKPNLGTGSQVPN